MAQIEPMPKKTKTVADLGDGLELRSDGLVYVGRRTATPTDVRRRYDLPADHPLYGERALRVVPSGASDRVISADGRLMPAIDPSLEDEPIGEVGAGDPRR